MNAPNPPHDPSQPNEASTDELVSAYVDGVAAPDEIAVVEASDELMARVASMRSVTAALGAPVTPPPEAVRENHLAAAMGEFDRLFGAESTENETELATVTTLPGQPPARTEPAAAAAAAAASAPGVTSLAEAREGKRPRRLNMVAAAAAVVALLFAGVVAVGLNTGGETTDVVSEASSDAATAAIESSDQMVLPEAADDAGSSARASADADDAMEEAMGDAMADDAMEELMVEEEAMADDAMDEAAATAEAMEDDAEAAFAAPVEDSMDDAAADDAGAAQSQPVGFLGAFESIDALAVAATTDLAAEPSTKAAEERSAFLAPTDCTDIAQELTGLDAATLVAMAFLGGEPVELHATIDDQILVLSSLDCAAIETLSTP